MSLTKRDFEAIAQAVLKNKPAQGNMKLGYYLAVTAVANGLAKTNPAFDRARFIQACTTPDDPVPEPKQLALMELEASLTP